MTGLPSDGGPVYARLWWFVAWSKSAWMFISEAVGKTVIDGANGTMDFVRDAVTGVKRRDRYGKPIQLSPTHGPDGR